MVGVKDEIDAIIWHGGNVQHSLSADSGYTTTLELESQLPDDTLGELYEDTNGVYTGVLAYYRDGLTGQQLSVTAGDPKKPKRLTHLYADRGSALRAVGRELLHLRS